MRVIQGSIIILEYYIMATGAAQLSVPGVDAVFSAIFLMDFSLVSSKHALFPLTYTNIC